MTVKKFISTTDQMSQLGKNKWYVTRLFELSKDFEVMDIPLDHMNMYYEYKNLTLRELAGHAVAIRDADLSFPIILDEDGEIMDGRHRLMKSIILEKETIKAVRFKINPMPCERCDNES